MAAPTSEALWDVDAVACRLGVQVRHVRRLVSHGKSLFLSTFLLWARFRSHRKMPVEQARCLLQERPCTRSQDVPSQQSLPSRPKLPALKP